MPRTWKTGRYVGPLLIVVAVVLILPFSSGPEVRAFHQAGNNWSVRSDAIKKKIDAEVASLEALYKQLHAHPELSFQEEQTAARHGQGAEGPGLRGHDEGRRPRRRRRPQERPGADRPGPHRHGRPAGHRGDRPALRQQGAARATRTATRSASCTPAATTCT